MPVSILCTNPDCKATFSVAEGEVGRAGRCPECGSQITLNEAPEHTQTQDSSPTTTAAISSLPPEYLGRYRILKKIGEGGMGSVYLAHDSHLDRQVALKLPHAPLRHVPEVLQRFQREARTAASFQHPNFCPVFDAGEAEGWHYLAMAYIDGRTLASIISRGGPMPSNQAAAIARKLALALQEAHERGITHRDLKPSNVMLSQRRELIIMDFGLARRSGTDDAELTHSGVLLGSPHYMAPEQVRGEKNAIGPASDVYALGVILYELLAGRRPFAGPMSMVLGLIALSHPDPPSKHRPDLEPMLEAVCLKAMAKNPADRFPAMRDLADALGAFLVNPSASSGFRPVPGYIPPIDQIQLVPEAEVDSERTQPPTSDEEDDGRSSYNLEGEASTLAAPMAAPAEPAEDAMVYRSHRPSRRPAREAVVEEGTGSFDEPDDFDTPDWDEPEPAGPGFFARNWHWFLSMIVLLGGGGFLGYWIATDFGSVQLTLESTGIVVRIDGRTIGEEEREGPIRLRTGSHELLATRGDQVVESRTLRVRRGIKHTVRVPSRPRTSPKKPPDAPVPATPPGD